MSSYKRQNALKHSGKLSYCGLRSGQGRCKRGIGAMLKMETTTKRSADVFAGLWSRYGR